MLLQKGLSGRGFRPRADRDIQFSFADRVGKGFRAARRSKDFHARIGLGEIGCIITSGVLIAQQSPKHMRGAVVGFFNLTGAVGILVASKLGGNMFDNWREAGPFVLFGLFAAVVMVWALVVRNRVQAPKSTA